MWSCCGLRKGHRADDQEPLLPRYEDETSLQRQLHQKLHSYQMLRALSRGYMPSNEQVIINLRTLLASPILNPETEDLSDAGQALVHYAKRWIKLFIEALHHKNSEDQIQDFIWYLSKARISVDTDDLAETAARSKAKADTKAGMCQLIPELLVYKLLLMLFSAYSSVRTVGSLLLTNSDFRLFLSDLNTVARQVLQDTAVTLSVVSKEAGKSLEPSANDKHALEEPNGSGSHPPPSKDDLQAEAVEVGEVLADGAGKVVASFEESVVEKATGDEKDTLLYRLKQTVSNLRSRRDYSDSVSTLSLLLRRYGMIYAHIGKDIVETIEEDVHTNRETDKALQNFWSFITSFGDQSEWNAVQERGTAILEHGREDPQFDSLIQQTGKLLQDMLMDPSFFDNAEDRFAQLRDNFRELTSESTLREDIDGLLDKAASTFKSVMQDQDIANLLTVAGRIAKVLSPAGHYVNGNLVTDSINVFVPAFIEAIQYVPIPRLEVSTPDIDLLLENLILESGKTVNHSSFLPYKFRVETQNNLEIRKARFRTTSSMESLVTLKITGISIAAEEIGFWLRAHSGMFRLADEGIASFHLDERGIDVELDIEIAKERLEQIVTLHAVRVKIHKLSYTLRKSKFSFFAWLLKPILKPIIRKTMEVQIASAIEDMLRAANRELLYARERLRATRIADPDDLWTFIKAVSARLVPEEDPDLYARVGVDQPGKGIFKGVYAPGSVVKLWHEEAMQAAQRTREYERGGWRNDIFDVATVAAT
jgi:hypothetical protein